MRTIRLDQIRDLESADGLETSLPEFLERHGVFSADVIRMRRRRRGVLVGIALILGFAAGMILVG